ncbi:hypothetical protein N0V88_004150 [Collariella sp. IMI 366227]|nr:hypothetical protein N0V88_004150 [Collariella sp. IMI 366227]
MPPSRLLRHPRATRARRFSAPRPRLQALARAPQRPVRIWWFDVSKQVFGSVLVHAANVFMSLLTSGRFSIQVVADPAAAQVVAGAAGAGVTTVGIPILILIVRLLTRLVALTPLGNPPESIQSGNYGSPPNAWWWLKQSVIYFCGLMGMKFCVLILFMALPWLPHIGDWALGWTEGNEKLQIVFVMMLFPLIMNAMQYYIIDSYIKKQEKVLPSGDDDDAAPVAYEALDASSGAEESEGEDEGEGMRMGGRALGFGGGRI